MCVCVRAYTHVSSGRCDVQKIMELELQEVVSHPTWVPQIKLWCSGKAGCARQSPP